MALKALRVAVAPLSASFGFVMAGLDPAIHGNAGLRD